MKQPLLRCSLCCDHTFETKLAFVDHLTNILSNLLCPVCNNKWSSIAHLIEHLNLDNCQPDYIRNRGIDRNYTSTTKLEKEIGDDIIVSESNHDENRFEDGYKEITLQNSNIENETLVTNGEMYLEILQRSDGKTCISNGNVNINDDDEIGQYVVMTESDLDLGGTIVSKQNSDGTISLQTLNDIKLASVSETVIAPSDNSQIDTQEELYSCNTCGVSFSSVLEHIQNFHTDQEVVVEETLESDILLAKEVEETIDHKPDAPKRVITDNGDIIETASIQDPLNKGGPYHKVIVKDVQANGKNIESYYCMSCKIVVTNLDDFKNQPCNEYKYRCLYCPVQYQNPKCLCAHMKVHKNRKAEVVAAKVEAIECEICSTKFPTNKSLKLHKRMHDPIKSKPIEPPVDTAESTDGTTARYNCIVCNKLIPIGYRALHQESHKKSEQLNCPICNKKFQSGEYLEMHMTVHDSEKVHVNKSGKKLPYGCVYCERRFARPHEKVKHERIHTGEKPYSCEVCGKSFRVAYCLTLHMRTHTGARPYACAHCGKRFKAHSVYNHHLMTHSEVRRYTCPFCPKAFKTSVQLAGHKKSHTKPFSCQHCNRPFASLYAVRVHSETHTRQNNLKFVCSLCGASYARAFALKDHMRQVHQQEVDTATLNEQASVEEAQSEWILNESNDETQIHETVLTTTEPIINSKIIKKEMNELVLTRQL